MSGTLPSKFADLLSRLQEHGEVRPAGDEWRTRCPAHDDSGPSLYVALSPDRSCILLNCKAGCEVDAIVTSLNLSLADLFLEDDLEVESDFGESQAAASPAASPSSGPADFDLRHQVYSDMLAQLALSDTHRQNLKQRGLDDATIDAHAYKTAEILAADYATDHLLKSYGQSALLQVPGFRLRDGRVCFIELVGLLVPVRDLTGKIVALKIRRDSAENGAKYLWISSSNTGGPSPGSPPHVPLGLPPQADVVRITEGELKADVAFSKSGLPTIGASGVSNWRPCLEIIKALQSRTVRLAFDQDQPPRPGVIKELRACAEGLLREGFAVELEVWANDGTRKGIDDLVAAGEKPMIISGQDVIVAIEQMSAAASASDDDDWLPGDPTAEVMAFPVDRLPAPLQKFVTEAAASMNCPKDFIGVPLLAVAAAAIGSNRILEIRPGFVEGPRFYGAIVAPAGSAKSPALKAVCEPVYAEQQRLREKFQRDKLQFEKNMEDFESNRKNPKDDRPDVLLVDKPIKPTMAHVFVSDATVEAMAPILVKCPRGLILIRDELTGWVLGMNQYKGGRGADRQFYLSCWSGEAAKIDRKSDQGESLLVLNPCLSVIGCIPPEKLAELDAENNCADGFVDRVLFSIPRPVQDPQWSWEGLSPETRNLWHTAVSELYALAGPVTVTFTTEARQVWAEWFTDRCAKKFKLVLA